MTIWGRNFLGSATRYTNHSFSGLKLPGHISSPWKDTVLPTWSQFSRQDAILRGEKWLAPVLHKAARPGTKWQGQIPREELQNGLHVKVSWWSLSCRGDSRTLEMSEKHRASTKGNYRHWVKLSQERGHMWCRTDHATNSPRYQTWYYRVWCLPYGLIIITTTTIILLESFGKM